VLGNIGEVNRKDIESDSYYTQGDYSGRTGIEQSYEEYLRGVKGVEILLSRRSRTYQGAIRGRPARYPAGIRQKLEIILGYGLAGLWGEVNAE